MARRPTGINPMKRHELGVGRVRWVGIDREMRRQNPRKARLLAGNELFRRAIAKGGAKALRIIAREIVMSGLTSTRLTTDRAVVAANCVLNHGARTTRAIQTGGDILQMRVYAKHADPKAARERYLALRRQHESGWQKRMGLSDAEMRRLGDEMWRIATAREGPQPIDNLARVIEASREHPDFGDVLPRALKRKDGLRILLAMSPHLPGIGWTHRGPNGHAKIVLDMAEIGVAQGANALSRANRHGGTRRSRVAAKLRAGRLEKKKVSSE